MPQGLRFAWPQERVQVVETLERKGRQATLTYVIALAPTEDGELNLTYEDMHFLAIEGADLEDPAVRASLRSQEEQLAQMQVGIRIDAEGRFIDILDKEVIIDYARSREGEESAEEMRRALEDPEYGPLLVQVAAKPWRCWVEVWVGLEADPGEVLMYDEPGEVGGVPVITHMQWEHLGSDPDVPENIRLRYTVTIDDTRVVAGLVGLAVGASGEERSEEEQAKMKTALENIDMKLVRTIEASVNPETLMPAWVQAESHTFVQDRRSSETEERVEVQRWDFVPS